jgi:hypothetical protein
VAYPAHERPRPDGEEREDAVTDESTRGSGEAGPASESAGFAKRPQPAEALEEVREKGKSVPADRRVAAGPREDGPSAAPARLLVHGEEPGAVEGVAERGLAMGEALLEAVEERPSFGPDERQVDVRVEAGDGGDERRLVGVATFGNRPGEAGPGNLGEREEPSALPGERACGRGGHRGGIEPSAERDADCRDAPELVVDDAVEKREKCLGVFVVAGEAEDRPR